VFWLACLVDKNTSYVTLQLKPFPWARKKRCLFHRPVKNRVVISKGYRPFWYAQTFGSRQFEVGPILFQNDRRTVPIPMKE
jgi:hypothetical protein